MRKTQTIIKNCKVHGETEFAVISGTNKSYCRKCKAEQILKRRNIVKQQCYEYLGNKCFRCGKIHNVYDFHHKNSKEKSINIGDYLQNNFNTLVQHELDKCILVCRNCHIKIHYK